jgi:photosystem II stability/assembly factor-like uncharacterized protein
VTKSNLYAGVGGNVGRPAQTGLLGTFSRQADDEVWHHVLEHKTFVVSVLPTDPNVVFSGTVEGVYRSIDHGKSFQRTDFPDRTEIWSLMVDARDPRVIYAGASPIAIYRSEDTGETWRKLPDPGMPSYATIPFSHRVMRMAQHPSEPDTIFAATEINGVMRTDDNGDHWTDLTSGLIALAQRPHLKSRIVSDTDNEGMLDGHAIVISPVNPDEVIVAVRMGLFHTVDRGETWEDMELGRFSPTTYGRDIRVSPQDGGTMYAALSVAAASKDGGVYRTPDGGKTWKRFDRVQVHGTIMSLALHQKDPDQLYFGARYEGEIFGTEDGGETWTGCPLPAGVQDLYSVAVG